MKILVVGNGAREHAIIEKLSQDCEVYALMSMNNPAIDSICKKTWLCNIENPQDVKDTLAGMDFDLGFASPDGTLAAGISDALSELGMKVASPTKAASRIEWDKSFMRELMRKNGISGLPKIFLSSDMDSAKEALGELGEVAVKPLGLTGGKGVRISGEHFNSSDEILTYCEELIKRDGKVLIEERLMGEEFTLQAFCDGSRMATMPPVQDHKRAYEGDEGPNTGGMGSYSTGSNLPFLRDSELDDAKKIMQDIINALAKEGAPFTGILYGQFMATANGVKVIEFNARFGDPEAMNVLGLLDSSLSKTLVSMADGRLEDPTFSNDATVVKYLVPQWYPDVPAATLGTLDTAVSIDDAQIVSKGAKVYYASVFLQDGKIHLTNSRSFGVLSRKPELTEAEETAESACNAVKGPVRHRKDIGKKELVQKKVDHMAYLRS